jgi:hypothetical protein
MSKGNGKNGANGNGSKRDPFGPARRQRVYRQRQKLKKIPAHVTNQKRTYVVHQDGSCTEIWPAGLWFDLVSLSTKSFEETKIEYSPGEWTRFCEMMTVMEPDKPWMTICQPAIGKKTN